MSKEASKNVYAEKVVHVLSDYLGETLASAAVKSGCRHMKPPITPEQITPSNLPQLATYISNITSVYNQINPDELRQKIMNCGS